MINFSSNEKFSGTPFGNSPNRIIALMKENPEPEKKFHGLKELIEHNKKVPQFEQTLRTNGRTAKIELKSGDGIDGYIVGKKGRKLKVIIITENEKEVQSNYKEIETSDIISIEIKTKS